MRPWAETAAQGRRASYGAKGLFHDRSRRSWATRRFSPIFGSILQSLAGNLPFRNRPVEPISSRAAARQSRSLATFVAASTRRHTLMVMIERKGKAWDNAAIRRGQAKWRYLA